MEAPGKFILIPVCAISLTSCFVYRCAMFLAIRELPDVAVQLGAPAYLRAVPVLSLIHI